jgi:hypothetical protein
VYHTRWHLNSSRDHVVVGVWVGLSFIGMVGIAFEDGFCIVLDHNLIRQQDSMSMH